MTPTMSRRHFNYIAHTIATSDLDEASKLALAKHFAGKLAMTNGKFNKDRFIAACTS